MSRNTRNGVVMNVLRSRRFDGLAVELGLTFDQLMQSRGWWQYEEAAEFGDMFIASYVKYTPDGGFWAVGLINESQHAVSGAVSYAVFSRFMDEESAKEDLQRAIQEVVDSNGGSSFFLYEAELKLLAGVDYLGPWESVQAFKRDFGLNDVILTSPTAVQQTL